MIFTFKNSVGGFLHDDRNPTDGEPLPLYVVEASDEREARRHLATAWWRHSGFSGARGSTSWKPARVAKADVQFERDRAAERRARFELRQIEIALDSADPAVRRATVLKRWWAQPDFDGGCRYTCGQCTLDAQRWFVDGSPGLLSGSLMGTGYPVAKHPGRECDACGTKSGGAAAVGGAS